MTQIIVLPKIQPTTRTQKGRNTQNLLHTFIWNKPCVLAEQSSQGQWLDRASLSWNPKIRLYPSACTAMLSSQPPLFNNHAETQMHILLPHPIPLLSIQKLALLQENIFCFFGFSPPPPPSSNVEEGNMFWQRRARCCCVFVKIDTYSFLSKQYPI